MGEAVHIYRGGVELGLVFEAAHGGIHTSGSPLARQNMNRAPILDNHTTTFGQVFSTFEHQQNTNLGFSVTRQS